MVKVMLVAGKSSKQLAEFLEQRGTFTVDFAYIDLSSNAEELLHSVIKVDKLIYIFRGSSDGSKLEMNVQQDMQLLRELLLNNRFFKTEEIVFLCSNGQESTQAKQYFNAVMGECGYTNFTIGTLDSLASYSSVYDNLIGVTSNKDFKNQYRNVYRRSRGDDARLAYKPTNDRDVIIEPFDYKGLQNWEERIKLANAIETKERIEDSDETRHTAVAGLAFKPLETGDIVQTGMCAVITGEKRAGKAVWATELAISARTAGKTVLVFDCSATQRTFKALSANGFAVKTSAEYLRMARNDNETAVCGFTLREDIEALAGVIALRGTGSYDCILIVVDQDVLVGVGEALGQTLTKIIAVVYATEMDVRGMVNNFTTLPGEKVLVMSTNGFGNRIDETAGDERMPLSAVKLEAPNIKVIKEYEFNGPVGPWLYNKVLEG